MSFFYKLLMIIRAHGLKEFLRRIYIKLFKIIEPFLNNLLEKHHQAHLDKILGQNRNKTVIIFPPLTDWNFPLFQRPQHIALNLGRLNFLYLYCTSNTHDRVIGFKEVSTNCIVTNRYDLCKSIRGRNVIDIYSTDLKMKRDQVMNFINNGNIILYEYIDEMNDGIAGTIPESTRSLFKEIMKNEKCAVVSSAGKLYDDVLKFRTRNHALVTNGVDYKHFSRSFTQEQIPKEIKELVREKKPLLGYYGALANWFDVELIKKLAEKRPQFNILLIGWNYQNDPIWSGLANCNIHILGPVNYKILPSYACWFDVCMIPFRINEITESTSPVKLFEFMAMGKPIVTTGMPECRKYKSVLIGEDHQDFIEKIDKAIILRKDESYLKLLKKEALENTWEAKAKQIADLISQNLDSGHNPAKNDH